jgi:hypothetical protein
MNRRRTTPMAIRWKPALHAFEMTFEGHPNPTNN